MMDDPSMVIYKTQVRGTPIDRLLDDLEAFATVKRWHLFDREIAIIREEIKRRLGDECAVYDREEVIEGCTVQILTNTETGDVSVGWWKEEKGHGYRLGGE